MCCVISDQEMFQSYISYEKKTKVAISPLSSIMPHTNSYKHKAASHQALISSFTSRGKLFVEALKDLEEEKQTVRKAVSEHTIKAKEIFEDIGTLAWFSKGDDQYLMLSPETSSADTSVEQLTNALSSVSSFYEAVIYDMAEQISDLVSTMAGVSDEVDAQLNAMNYVPLASLNSEMHSLSLGLSPLDDDASSTADIVQESSSRAVVVRTQKGKKKANIL